MIEEPTVFILGAGASVPYNYPTGDGLKQFIVSNFGNDFMQSFRRVDEIGIFTSEWQIKIDAFEKALAGSSGSIDLFLSRRPRFLELGKLAILYSIFHFESSAKFGWDSNQNEGDWYTFLYDQMAGTFREPGLPSLNSNSISFVTFNYDRSLEEFLFRTTISSFGEEFQSEIIDQLKKIDVLHVYGQIAKPIWEYPGDVSRSDSTKADPLHFLDGPDAFSNNPGRIRESAKSRIFVVGEERNKYQEHIGQIRQKIENSRRIFFLGFSYAAENMSVLGFPQIRTSDHKIFGTTIGLTTHEVQNIEDRYFTTGNKKHRSLRLENKNCLELLRDNIYH